MQKNVQYTLCLSILQIAFLLNTATGQSTNPASSQQEAPVVTPVLTTLLPGLGSLLKETKDQTTRHLPDAKKPLFNPIFTLVAKIQEKPIRVHNAYIGNTYWRDVSTGVYEEKMSKIIFTETAKDLSVKYNKVSPLFDALLLSNAFMRFSNVMGFAGFDKWFYTDRPQILDENLNPLAPAQYFPHFVNRVEQLKELLAAHTTKETNLILALIATAASSQLKSCKWYFLPELLKSLSKKISKVASLKYNKREHAIILNEIKDFIKETESANRFIIFNISLLAPKSENVSLIKKLRGHKKASIGIGSGFGTATFITLLIGSILAENSRTWSEFGLALTPGALLAAIGSITYGIHAATKPKVVIQPTE
jgi:hypothetical protein